MTPCKPALLNGLLSLNNSIYYYLYLALQYSLFLTGFIVLYVIYVTLVIAGQALNRTIRNTGTVSDYESTVNSTDEGM